MKRIFAILMVLFTTTSFASVTDEVKQYTVFKPAIDFSEITKQQLSIVEERMKQINPDLVKAVKDDTDEMKIVKYNNYLAEKVFNDYKDFFFKDLEEKSQETGRELMADKYNNNTYTYHWLNRGILDTDECIPQYWAKNRSRIEVNKQLKDEREHTCFYPDGFEDYSISWSGSNTIETLIVDRDFYNDKEHVSVSVSMVKPDNENNSDNIMADWVFSIGYNVYDYEDFYAKENQRKQDIKDGMYQYIPKKRQGCEKGNPFCTPFGVEDMKKWKSASMPLRVEYRDLIIERGLTYQKN